MGQFGVKVRGNRSQTMENGRKRCLRTFNVVWDGLRTSGVVSLSPLSQKVAIPPRGNYRGICQKSPKITEICSQMMGKRLLTTSNVVCHRLWAYYAVSPSFYIFLGVLGLPGLKIFEEILASYEALSRKNWLKSTFKRSGSQTKRTVCVFHAQDGFSSFWGHNFVVSILFWSQTTSSSSFKVTFPPN